MAFPSAAPSSADAASALVVLSVLGAYLYGARCLWATDASYWPLRTRHGRLPLWRVALFVAGVVIVGFGFSGVASGWGQQMFALHALQHHVLTTVGAPLIVLGDPTVAFGGLLPPWQRRRAQQLGRGFAACRAFRLTLGRPLVVWLGHVLILWLGYLPSVHGVLHDQALLHTLHHVALFASGLALWWLLIGPGTTWLPRARGQRTVATLAGWLQNNALSALIAFSPVASFPQYQAQRPLWDLGPQEAQYLAGAVQYLPAEIVYLFALSVLVFGWLTDADRRATDAAQQAPAAAPSLPGAARSGLLTRREQMLREEWHE